MDKISKIIILVFAVSVFGAFGWGILTEAGSGDNVSGFAYSENIGWVSFNSTSDGSSVSYGVNLDSGSGNLSGEAWSENIGWISFDRSDTGNPPAAPFNGGSGPIAQYDFNTDELTGWMRVLAYAGGWDGWIRFCDSTIANCSGAGQVARIDPATGDWHGWAWSDMVVGWLSLNGADPGAGGDYKVTIAGGLNRPPSASIYEVIKGDYCDVPVHRFFWIYSDPDGHNESQFQLQVDNNSDFSSPEVNICGDAQSPVGGVCPAGTLDHPDGYRNEYPVIVTIPPVPANRLGYNTTYYWRVKVWDSQGGESDWIPYNDPADPDGDGYSDRFTTEKHRYPSIDFSWSPTEPSQEEDVLFSDQSTVYGGAAKSAWAWTFTNGNPASSGQQNQTIQFTSEGSKQVTLKVTDSDTYFCQISKSVGVQAKLPGWIEVLPQ